MPADGAGLAVAFAVALRRAGLEVAVSSVTGFVDALGAVGLDDRTGVYWAGRATLVRRPEDVAAYDAAFDGFWLGGAHPLGPVPAAQPVTLVADDAGADDDSSTPVDEWAPETVSVRWSAVEVLRRKDFAACTAAELDEAHRLMSDLRLAGSLRRSSRLRRSSARSSRPDVRRTVRAAMRTGGEPLRRRHLDRSWKQRRVILLCDVSGSMEPYARALLRFAHTAVSGGRRVEAFTLGTRLTRLTRELSSRDPDAALGAASRSVEDWSGGTRLGEGLRQFNDRWGVRGMARGAVVVVLSDGWDRGEPDVLGAEMERLHRVVHRLVWVNPLKAAPGYAPLARGMAAALPHVDEFVEGHSLASLEELAEVVAR